MAGQGGFASGHRRIRRSEAFGGRAPAEERTGAIGGGAFGGPTTGAQGTREARTTTVLVGRISRKESVEAGNPLFGDCRSQGAQS